MFNNRELNGEGDTTENEPETNKSFVKKVKSRVSEFLPTTLTKWFTSNPVQKMKREDIDDEDSFSLQPPAKRQKLPPTNSRQRNYDFDIISTPLHNESVPVVPNFVIHRSFDEATPGPSGINSRKYVLPTVTEESQNIFQNGDKDTDSDCESTSGYSSMHRIGSKEQVSETMDKHYTPNKSFGNRSLFSRPLSQERSLFSEKDKSPQGNTSVSSRLPSFNITSFGSPNFMDRTISTQRIVNSPFYGGRTAYGGASAYTKHMKRSPESNSTLKSFVQVKSVDDSKKKSFPLSRTAKRILDGLEQFSSASEDIRKIPNPSKRVQKPEGLISKYTGANPYVLRDSRVPSNRELQVPMMSDLLKMKLKERLQDSTVSVREMATKSKCPLNTEEYKIRSNKDISTKTTNKIKTKVSSVRHNKPIETIETSELVKLPEVQLPITTLPSFDFKIPSPFSAVKKNDTEKLTKKEETKPSSKKGNKPEILQNILIKQKEPVKNTISKEFNFSKPLVIADNLKISKYINNYTFCEPINMKHKTNSKPLSSHFKSCIPTINLKMKTPPKNNGEFLPLSAATELIQTGSVMDILGKNTSLMEKFKPIEGSWECDVCMLRNLPDKEKCSACENARKINKQGLPPRADFGDKFKKSENQWECSDCMIRNDASKVKCAACEAPKPTSMGKVGNKDLVDNKSITTSNTWECSKCKIRNDNSKINCGKCFLGKANIPIKSNFGDKWECSTCLIRNDSDKLKCAACEADKPGSSNTTKGLMDKFKVKDGEWECSSCMVKNSADKTQCVCCDSLKPGSLAVESLQPMKSIPKFSFGIDNSKTNGHDFIFGIKPNVRTETNTVPAASIFGEGAKPVTEQSTSGFSFGIPAPNGAKPSIADVKTVTENKSELSKGFTFGAPTQIKDNLKRTRPEDNLSEKKSDIFNNNSSINGEIKITSSCNTSTPIITSVSKDTINKETTSIAASNKPVFTFKSSTDEPNRKVSILSSPESSNIASTSQNNVTPFKFNSTKTDSSTKSLFTFGNKKADNKIENTGIGFNFMSKPASSSSAKLGFGFPTPKTERSNVNAPAEVKPMFSSTANTNIPSFSIPISNPNVATSSTITFGPGSVNAPTFGSSTNATLFGNTPTTVSNPPMFGSNSAFSLPSQAPINGGFNFGSNTTPTPKTGFNFGASPAQPTFNFGASSNTQSTSGGFNFSPAGTPNTFNADPKPSFNFTGGVTQPSFKAKPKSGVEQHKGRVIRRALRRTQ